MNDLIFDTAPYKSRKQYKIRQLTKNNSSGDAFGITIPSAIALKFDNIFFKIFFSNDMIILKSGTCIYKKEGEIIGQQQR